jgi:phosphatidylglycerol---prolipoprotein diacylglyceryl transferase
VPTTEEVHPTPVYETLTMFAITWFLWSRRHKYPPGGLFALYLVLAGAERFLVEFLRRNDRIVAGLTLPQLIAAAIFVVGAIWLLRIRSTGGVPAPARS